MSTTNFSGKIPSDTKDRIEKIKSIMREQKLEVNNTIVIEEMSKSLLHSLENHVTEGQHPETIQEVASVQDDMSEGISFEDVKNQPVEEIEVSFDSVVKEYNELIRTAKELGLKDVAAAKSVEKSELGGIFLVMSEGTTYSVNASMNFKEDLSFFAKALSKGRVNAGFDDEALQEKYGNRYPLYKEFRDIAKLKDMHIEICSLNPVNTLKGLKEYMDLVKDGVRTSVKWGL